MNFLFLDGASLFLGLILAPAAYLLSLAYRRGFTHVLLEWKKANLVIYTILAFVLNLSLFVLTCFFFAGWLGHADGIRLVDIPAEQMKHIGTDCCMLLIGCSVAYLAMQNFYTQFVTQAGIYLGNPLFDVFRGRPRAVPDSLIRWEQIKDYYLRSDYPITFYRFIVQMPDGTYINRVLKVPFYMMPRFEVLLELNLRKQQEIREQSRTLYRKMSRN